MTDRILPELLAPAGDKSCFLAALAAGADATYMGLKNFSARAGAENFSIADLAAMVDLANQHGRKVYVAFNSLVKESDLGAASRLIYRLQRDAQPHALIIQDIGLIDIARQAGAKITGIGIAVEKGNQNGGRILREEGYHLESLAIIEEMNYETQTIKFRE